MAGVTATTLLAWCRCGHCGAVRRLRLEGEFASCVVCGKVLLELASRMRKRRKGRGREGRAPGRGGTSGADGVRRESDAESTG
jgi:hypothetical protein